MNDKRPVNLDVVSWFPITAIVSILHRGSGVVLFAGIAVLLWALQQSLASEESFQALKDNLSNPLCKFIIWATVAALLYHLVAGLRHLVMDMGIGETYKGGRVGAILVIIISAVVIALAGVWLW